jgi:type IV secretory pathway component VirB8
MRATCAKRGLVAAAGEDRARRVKREAADLIERTAGIAFCVLVAAIAALALTTLTPSRKRSTQAAPALSHPAP